jgi:aspartate kinase
MIVMKFGGTSLRDAACIRTVHQLVERQRPRQPVVVASAHAGVTNSLERLAQAAVRQPVDLAPLVAQHQTILRELGLDPDLHAVLFRELQDLLRGIRLVGEASPRSMDYVLSFGERFSARTVAAALRKHGLPATAIDAFDAGLRTDGRFGRARPLPDDGRIKAELARLEGVPVVTGYIAKDEAGNITTLGRNGSDYSAALFGNAVDAEEIQIWTDVDGVMTADPKLVAGVQPIDKLSFAEASELAYYGGKVLHPSTLLPAMQKRIPVRVLNTHCPDSLGTLIMETLEEPGPVVRCIAHKRGIHLITIVSTRMLQQHGFLARIFSVFDRLEIVIDMVSTTEVSVSVTTDADRNLPAALEELREFADVQWERDQALVCVVGKGIAKSVGVPGDVFASLRDAEVSVRMISLGALKVNISFLVAERDLSKAVNTLHDRFFIGSGANAAPAPHSGRHESPR